MYVSDQLVYEVETKAPYFWYGMCDLRGARFSHWNPVLGIVQEFSDTLYIPQFRTIFFDKELQKVLGQHVGQVTHLVVLDKDGIPDHLKRCIIKNKGGADIFAPTLSTISDGDTPSNLAVARLMVRLFLDDIEDMLTRKTLALAPLPAPVEVPDVRTVII